MARKNEHEAKRDSIPADEQARHMHVDPFVLQFLAQQFPNTHVNYDTAQDALSMALSYQSVFSTPEGQKVLGHLLHEYGFWRQIPLDDNEGNALRNQATRLINLMVVKPSDNEESFNASRKQRTSNVIKALITA